MFTGSVPRHKALGVVARSASLAGATALAGAARSPSAVIMPSKLSVPAGGSPRVAAFLVVSDKRGRLSRGVPLNVQSDNGRLHALTWLKDGIAAVQLSVDSHVREMDLRVSVSGHEPIQKRLSVSSGWPVRGALVAPDKAFVGEAIALRVSAVDSAGQEVEPGALRIRCGTNLVTPSADGTAACDGTSAKPGDLAVSLNAWVDGRAIPIGYRRVRLEDRAPAPAARRTPLTADSQRAAKQDSAAGFRVAGLGHGGIDAWGQPAYGVVLRGLLPELGILRPSAGIRYSQSRIDASPSSPVQDQLTGTSHNVDVLLGTDLAIVRGKTFAFMARGDVGPTLVTHDAKVGAVDASDQSARFSASAGVGPAMQADNLELQSFFGARYVTASNQSWEEAPIRFFAEIGGAFDVGR